MDGCRANDKRISVEKSFVDQCKLEKDARKGILVYLHDVLSMEFSVNKLERALKIKETSHDKLIFINSSK